LYLQKNAELTKHAQHAVKSGACNAKRNKHIFSVS